MIAIGIDPGKSGALAILDFDADGICRAEKVIPFSEEGYREELSKYADVKNIKCCLERVSAMPGQGVKSMFNFGANFGFIQGVLQAFKIPYQTVPPRTWKKEYSLTSDKQGSIDTCKKMFPYINLLPTSRCRKENDGMAEAVLMAEYARRKL